MKVRIEVPQNVRHDAYLTREWVDGVEEWGRETGMDAAYYSYYYDDVDLQFLGKPRGKHAVFTVEPDYVWMFSMKWNAVPHKTIRLKKDNI
jgi:hypothetical protein